jgi:hypothetical protein
VIASFSWFSNLFPSLFSSEPQVETRFFNRGRIEMVNPKTYKIFSDDGIPGHYILLKLESLDEISKRIREEALLSYGNIEQFNRFYADYFNTTFWQIQKHNCDRRLSLWRVNASGNKVLAWVLDFRVSVSGERLLSRLFSEIKKFQFVEESDWYSYVLGMDWEDFFKKAVGEYDITCFRPVQKGFPKRKVIDEVARLRKQQQQEKGEATQVAAIYNRSRKIPYEAIAKLIISKSRKS